MDEPWLSVGGAKRPVAVVLGPQGERLDLRLSGPGCDGNDGFTVLAERGVRGVTTDDAPVYGPALRASGLDRQQCAVPRQRTVGRPSRRIDDDGPAHRDRVRLPILQRLTRERPPEVQALLWHLVEGWNDLVRSPRDPAVPASTNRPGAGRVPSGRASSPGPA